MSDATLKLMLIRGKVLLTILCGPVLICLPCYSEDGSSHKADGNIVSMGQVQEFRSRRNS